MTRKEGALHITLTKSLIGSCPKVRKTAAALGLARVGQTVVRPANDSVRGMTRTINHLVKVDEG
ncbi:MAG: 50S ribosomal protein L30 [Armatimonadetes bacterium]|nr:50S ribosomal protein L30 [Armatimonadota bacterium]